MGKSKQKPLDVKGGAIDLATLFILLFSMLLPVCLISWLPKCVEYIASSIVLGVVALVALFSVLIIMSMFSTTRLEKFLTNESDSKFWSILWVVVFSISFVVLIYLRDQAASAVHVEKSSGLIVDRIKTALAWWFSAWGIQVAYVAKIPWDRVRVQLFNNARSLEIRKENSSINSSDDDNNAAADKPNVEEMHECAR